MRKVYFSIAVIVSLLYLNSCTSRKRIMYFNDITQIAKEDSTNFLKPLKVQTGDILQIIISSINKDISLMYNPSANFPNSNTVAQGYLVDHDGNIELPQLGKLIVRNKTIDDINNLIKTELDKSIKNAFVSTRMLNFKVSVLGDVAKPGSFTIANERVSILEALSLAGDANVSAKRDDVLLIREREGKKSYVTLNLNDSKILSSPYYYLTNNDVIYIRPGLNKFISSSGAVQLLPLIATGATLILVFYSSVLKK